MTVMEASQQERPRIRRLGDRLGAWYTPIALFIAAGAWIVSGDPVRFLAVLVVATPCPLLIAIPVAVIGSISLAAKRSIVVRDPTVLETVSSCRTIIFDKTGTLTYGRPELVDQIVVPGREPEEVLSLVASLEQYSKHPLADAIVQAGRRAGAVLHSVTEVHEPPGQGLRGHIAGHEVRLTSRKQISREEPAIASRLPTQVGGMECIILIDGQYAATYRFRDVPRREGVPFIDHLHRAIASIGSCWCRAIGNRKSSILLIWSASRMSKLARARKRSWKSSGEKLLATIQSLLATGSTTRRHHGRDCRHCVWPK